MSRNGPYQVLSSHQLQQRGRQLPVEYAPTHQATSSSPIGHNPNLVQSLKNLQQIFALESHDFHSVKQQLATSHKIRSQSPLNTSSNYYSQPTHDQQFLTQTRPANNYGYSQTSKNALKPDIPRQGILKKELAESIVKQYLSSDYKYASQNGSAKKFEHSTVASQTTTSKNELFELSKQGSIHHPIITSPSNFDPTASTPRENNDAWKNRYFALQEQLGGRVQQLESELLKYQNNPAAQQTDQRELQQLREQLVKAQSEKALMIQQFTEKDKQLETYRQTMKKMSIQLDQYEKALTNYTSNMKEEQLILNLRKKLEKQEKTIKNQKQLLTRFKHLEQDLPQLCLVKGHLDKIVDLMKGSQGQTFKQVLAGQVNDDSVASQVDLSGDISQNEQPNKQLLKTRTINAQHLLASQENIEPQSSLVVNDQNLNDIIRRNLQKRRK